MSVPIFTVRKCSKELQANEFVELQFLFLNYIQVWKSLDADLSHEYFTIRIKDKLGLEFLESIQ